MSRDLSASNKSETEAPSLTAVAFVKLEYDSGPVCFHTGVGEITWGGNTYTGAGNLGDIGVLNEEAELGSNPLLLTLSGIPTSLIGTILNEHYQGRPATVYIGFLDEQTEQLVDTPDVAYGGFMDTVTFTRGETATITMQLANELAAWNNPVIRRYNNGDQQTLYPGDLGLEFVERTVNKTIAWGTPS